MAVAWSDRSLSGRVRASSSSGSRVQCCSKPVQLSTCCCPDACSMARALSHQSTSTSTAGSWDLAPRPRRGRHGHGTGFQSPRSTVKVRALFDPPPFQPSKLEVSFSGGAGPGDPAPDPPTRPRRYTLTHNDLTGQLWLTVGREYNHRQISGFYTRLLRDEVTAEWRASDESDPSLHVFCHVSGEERWLAPPVLRNYIFRREMPLVLDCVLFAERSLLRRQPMLGQAQVYIHFESSVQAFNSVESWGVLGRRHTWPAVPTSIMKRMVYSVMQKPLDELSTGDALPGAAAAVDTPGSARGPADLAARLSAPHRPIPVVAAAATLSTQDAPGGTPADARASGMNAAAAAGARIAPTHAAPGDGLGQSAATRAAATEDGSDAGPGPAAHAASAGAADTAAESAPACSPGQHNGSAADCAPVAGMAAASTLPPDVSTLPPDVSAGADAPESDAAQGVQDQASGVIPGAVMPSSGRHKPAEPALVSTRK